MGNYGMMFRGRACRILSEDPDGPYARVQFEDDGQSEVVDRGALVPWSGVCGTCGGTVLPPTRNGVARGTCHCKNAREVYHPAG